MEISYLSPLGAAWRRTSRMLFHPLNPSKWLVLGFAAWLATLASGGAGAPRGGGINYRVGRPSIGMAWREAERAWRWLSAHLFVTPLVLAVVLGVVGLILLLVWLSSRGKLVFLDGVANDRAAVVEPWRRLGRLGDSLFLWRLGFGLAGLAATAAIAAVTLAIAGGMPFRHVSAREAVALGFGGLAAVLLVIVLAYVALFLDAFVVPIMYRNQLTATAAWRAFLPWLERYLGVFLLYGILVLAYWLTVAVLVLIVGFGTCCVGFLVLGFPYVGTVVLLPVHVAYRALSLEFLAQLDPGFQVLSPLE